MKHKTTQKAIKSNYNTIFSIGYCAAQNLLHYERESAYTCGVYGWNADIYDIEGVAIVTGYRPFGKNVSYENLKQYEDAAEKIIYDYSSGRTYEEKKAEVRRLLHHFILSEK